MGRMINSTAVAMVVVSVCSARLAAQAAPSPRADSGRTTLSGVYSAKQAERGEKVYMASCLECHVPSDYTGEAFTSKFVGGTAFDMFEVIRSTMPQNNPSSLSNEQYVDVVAYLFKLNALPTSESDLSVDKDSLKAIKVEAKPPVERGSPTQRTTHGATKSHKSHGPSNIR